MWPGLGMTGLAVAPLARALPYAIAVDPPGHGESPVLTREEYSLPALAVRAAEALAETGARIFVGHSWGGAVGVALAAARPEGLASLVLLDGGFLDSAGRASIGLELPADDDGVRAAVAARSSAHSSWEAAFADWRRYVVPWSDDAEHAVRDALVERDGNVVDRFSADAAVWSFAGLRDHDALADARTIGANAIPTLLLGALRTPAPTPAKLAALERFADAGRPCVELRTCEEWGHHLVLEARDDVVPLVVEWLTSRR